MSDTRALYEQVILDHNKNPRNFKKLPDATHHAEGFNPLCGDQITVYLKLDGDRIADLAFDGQGCAIVKSSGSIMTSQLKGKTVEEARALFERFHQMVTSAPDAEIDTEPLGKLQVFGGVREYPVRIKCATLAWHALSAALDGNVDEIVTTE